MADEAPPLELEHLIGYAGETSQSVQAHVRDANMMVYHVSSLVVVASTLDPHKQTLLRGHTEDVTCLAQSVDGEYLASGQKGGRGERSGDAYVYVWSYAQGVPIYRLTGLKSRATAVAFSRDNRFVAGADDENRLLVWDLQNGQVVNATRHERPISFIAFGPIIARESKRGAARPSLYRFAIGVGSNVKEVSLDFNTRSMQYEVEQVCCGMPASGLKREFADGAYAGERDEFVLVGTRAGELCVFAMAAEPPPPPPDGATAAGARRPGVFRACVPVSAGVGGVHALAVAGEFVWLGSGDGKVKRFSGADQAWAMEAETALGGRVVALSLTADRRGLIAGTSAGQIWALDAGSLAPSLLCAAHTAPVVAAAFAAGSSERVATASADGSVRVWDLSSYGEVFAATRAAQLPTSIALGGEPGGGGGGGGALLLVGWADGAVYCYDPESAEPPRAGANGARYPQGYVWSIATAHAGAVSAVALTALAIVSAGLDGKVRVWGLGSRRCEAEYSEHTKPITALVVDCREPNHVHTCGLDQLVVSLDLKKGKRITYHALREGQFTAMAQRPHGDLELLTATHDGLVFVWDVDEIAPVGMLREPGAQRLNALALSPSGKWLVVCTDQAAEVQVWDLASGKPGANQAPVALGLAHSEGVSAAAWSPDEKQLITVGKDGLIAVWNWFGF